MASQNRIVYLDRHKVRVPSTLFIQGDMSSNMDRGEAGGLLYTVEI